MRRATGVNVANALPDVLPTQPSERLPFQVEAAKRIVSQE
jgi:hypothetical protein